MKFARIVAAYAVDVRAESPEGCFTPEVVAEFQEIPDQVEDGWMLVNGVWTATEVPPPPPAPITPTYTPIGPIAFQMLFTIPELTAIQAAYLSDPVVKILWDLVKDPRTTVIDRSLQFIQTGMQHFEASNYIGAGRAEVILRAEGPQ